MAEDILYQKFGRTYQEGDLIFLEHEFGDEIFVLIKGRVKISKIDAGQEKTLAILKDGDIFGEMAVLEKARRSATAMALEPCKMLAFKEASFNVIFSASPDMAVKLIKIFSNRIVTTARQIDNLSLNNPNARVADTFMILFDRMRRRGPQAYRNAKFTVDAQEIANMAGYKVEQVEEILRDLSREGKIRIGDGEIIVYDVQDLSRMVAFYRKKESYSASTAAKAGA